MLICVIQKYKLPLHAENKKLAMDKVKYWLDIADYDYGTAVEWIKAML